MVPRGHRRREVFFAMTLPISEVYLAEGVGYSVSGTSIFEMRMVPGAFMMTAASSLLGIVCRTGVCGHAAAGDVGHDAGNDGHGAGAGEVGVEWAGWRAARLCSGP